MGSIVTIITLLISLLKYLPAVLSLLQSTGGLLATLGHVWKTHFTHKSPVPTTPVQRTVAALQDTHAVLQAHIAPLVTPSVIQAPLKPVPLPPPSNMPAINAIIDSDTFKKIEHPDFTEVPDYLQKYVTQEKPHV